VSWYLKRQGLISLSSTGAEFIAGTEATRKHPTEKVSLLYSSNQDTLALAKHTGYRPRTKHIYVCAGFITHMVESGQYLIDYIATQNMVVDALTKHAKAMGLLYTAP